MTGYTNIPLTVILANPADFVTVCDSQKNIYKIPVFSNENGHACFRFTHSLPQKCTWSTKSESGSFELKKYQGNNTLYTHGRVIAKEKQRYLQHLDGTPFFWLADTWWFAMTSRMEWQTAFKALTAVRKKQGFTVIQLVIGYPPEIKLTSMNAANEGGLPFNSDGEINPDYFHHVDKKIAYLVENGLVPCIVGSWGHHLDMLGKQKIRTLWKEIIARYSSYPVIFCLTGEVDIVPPPGYDAREQVSFIKKFTKRILPLKIKNILKKMLRIKKTPLEDKGYTLSKRLNMWAEIAAYIKQNTPFPVPLTIHVAGTKTASELFHQPPWLDIDTTQSGHSNERRKDIVKSIYNSQENSPFINLEPWYEQIMEQFGPLEQRYAFWMSYLSGASGYSYGAQGVWNMNTDKSSFLTHWGKATWEKGQAFEGANHLARAKKFLMTKKWWKVIPCNEMLEPRWSENNAFHPVAARIGEELMVYCPATDKNDVTIFNSSQNPHFTISWYDPVTMKRIKTKEYTDKQDITVTLEIGRDQLLLIS